MESNSRVLSLANVVRLRTMAISCKRSKNLDGIGTTLPESCIQSLVGVVRRGIVGIPCNICTNASYLGNLVPDGSFQHLAVQG